METNQPKTSSELKIRTNQQNRALHLYCAQLAEILNDAGLDMKQVLKPGIKIDWTKESVKKYLVKPILKIKTNKTSTTQMDTWDINGIYDVLNRFLSEEFHIHVPFPSLEIVADKIEKELEKGY